MTYINCSDIHELVETVSYYINFCVETCIPTKTVTVYPNNKPWITKQIKDVINKKKGLFRPDILNHNELQRVKKELKRVIKTEKIAYRNKIEEHFTDNNMKRVWEGMRLMSRYSNASSKSSQLPDCNAKYANELNTF